MNKELYHNMRVEFTNNCKKYLNPKLRKYEAQRLDKLKKIQTVKQWAIVLGVIFGILSFLFFFSSHSFFGMLCFQALIVSLVGQAIYRQFSSKGFETELKEECLNNLCKCFETIEWHKGACGYGFSEAKKTCLFQKYNRESYDDIFKGSYNGVNFDIIEADYDYESGSGEDRRTYNVFNGAIIKIAMNKNFKTHTVIRPHKMTNTGKHLKRTVLEDIVFENKFDVYTDDEIEARYLITTAFMERLNNIQRIFNINKIACAFYKGNLYIALYTAKDLFKLFDINKPIDNYEQLMIFFNEILSIYKCIDYFKLNEKTGL